MSTCLAVGTGSFPLHCAWPRTVCSDPWLCLPVISNGASNCGYNGYFFGLAWRERVVEREGETNGPIITSGRATVGGFGSRIPTNVKRYTQADQPSIISKADASLPRCRRGDCCRVIGKAVQQFAPLSLRPTNACCQSSVTDLPNLSLVLRVKSPMKKISAQ